MGWSGLAGRAARLKSRREVALVEHHTRRAFHTSFAIAGRVGGFAAAPSEVEDCTFTFGMNASCEVDQIDERAKSSRHTFGVLGAIKTKLEAITFEWRATIDLDSEYSS